MKVGDHGGSWIAGSLAEEKAWVSDGEFINDFSVGVVKYHEQR